MVMHKLIKQKEIFAELFSTERSFVFRSSHQHKILFGLKAITITES